MTPFSVTAPSATLSAFRGGEGSPLLLLMGVAGHHAAWGPRFVDRLMEHHDVVVYDHRGIGESGRVDEPFTEDDLVDDALAVMDAAGWDDAHLVGFSMGGAIAQSLVLREPARARTLTLIGTWADTDDVWGDQIASLAQAGEAPDRETALRMMFEGNVSAAFANEPGRFEEFAEAAASVKVPTPVVLHQMGAVGGHDVRDRLGEIDVPTLVVHGENDGIIRFAAGQRLAEGIPGARFEPMLGRGHHVAWEAGDQVADLVLAHTG